jgi:hypothetical protein
MTQDEDHLRLLSIFHYVVGGLAALFALFPIFHMFLGLFLILAPEKFGNKGDAPPAFIGWFFVAIAACFMIAGWTFAALVIMTGRFLARRKYYTFCFVMAAVECLFMPFGTVLAVFTLVVLLRESVKRMFEANKALASLRPTL